MIETILRTVRDAPVVDARRDADQSFGRSDTRTLLVSDVGRSGAAANTLNPRGVCRQVEMVERERVRTAIPVSTNSSVVVMCVGSMFSLEARAIR